jgi:hypothetical protein
VFVNDNDVSITFGPAEISGSYGDLVALEAKGDNYWRSRLPLRGVRSNEARTSGEIKTRSLSSCQPGGVKRWENRQGRAPV